MNDNSKTVHEALTDAELDIMRVLWKSEKPLRASEITKKLSGERSWKSQTAHVLLGRLEEKGFVEADKSGYFHTFRAKLGEGDYFASESGALLRRVGGSFKSLVASMIETDGVTHDELRELKALLDEKCAELGIRGEEK